MYVINEMGGVTIKKSEVKFGDVHCAVAAHRLNVCKIGDKDFEANFDGEKWTVKWKWKGEPPVLQNRVKFYKNSLESEKNSEFEEEVERWIVDGIFVPWKGKGKGMLPLVAVFQATKKKVRPVLDFHEMNRFVAYHTGSDIIDVCVEKMRKWRRLEGGTAIVDLKSAYLQLHGAKELWQYQLVSYKGKTYCLTRLGFGQCCAEDYGSQVKNGVEERKQNKRGHRFVHRRYNGGCDEDIDKRGCGISERIWANSKITRIPGRRSGTGP